MKTATITVVHQLYFLQILDLGDRTFPSNKVLLVKAIPLQAWTGN
jgi:hypothetical protein